MANINTWSTIDICDVKQMPLTRGCYAVLCDEAVLYIGRAKLLWTRLQRIQSHKTIQKIIDTGVDIKLAYSVDDYDNEKALIQEHKPPYNVDYISKWDSQVA